MPLRGRRFLRAWVACVLLVWAMWPPGYDAAADVSPPLHQRIDQLIDEASTGPAVPAAGDAEFLRRVHLALIGRIPSPAEARAFLADTSETKRAAVVDRLLADDASNRRLATWLDAMLMERRPDQSVPSADWRRYLENAFATAKPYNQLVREILTADGADPAMRPAAKFVLDRGVSPIIVTRDVGRLFFGRDLQCAQCHDHPLIDSYRQAEYHGLYSFFSRSSLFTHEPSKVNYIADVAAGEVTFVSVFKKSVTYTSLPQVPGGPVVRDPAVPAGGEYLVKPDKNVRPVPAYSRRLQLAASITTGRNELFNRNLVNRLWSLMMGRGLVEPLDLHHAENPASYPQVLDLLADEFVAMDYDVKAMLRELALTRTFGRAMDAPQPTPQQATQAAAQLAALAAEHQKLSELVAPSWTQVEAAEKALDDASKARAEAAGKLTAANNAVAEAKKAADAAAAAHTVAQQLVTTQQGAVAALKEAAAKAGEAAKALPQDKEVADALAKLQARAAAVEGEIAAATAAIEPAAAAAKAATEKLAAAQAAAKQEADALAPLDQQAEATKQAHAAAFAAWTAHQSAAALAKQKRDAAQKLVDYGTLAALAAESRAAAEAAAAQLADVRQRTQVSGTTLPQRQVELAAAQQQADKAAADLAATQQQIAEKQRVADQFAQTIADIESAQRATGENADMGRAAAGVKELAAPVNAELAAMNERLASQQAAAAEASQKLAAATSAMQALTAEQEQVAKRLGELEPAASSATAKAAADAAAVDAAYTELMQAWTREFAISSLEPLSPEQIAWSTMQATGLIDATRAAAKAELDQKSPLPDVFKDDPAILADRAQTVERMVYDKLKGHEAVFVRLFGVGPGQDPEQFAANIDQALFLANDGLVRSWLAPAGGNLTDRLVKTEDAAKLAEELYISALTRLPTAAEVEQVRQYLEKRSADRPVAIGELAWALLASAEFRFRH